MIKYLKDQYTVIKINSENFSVIAFSIKDNSSMGRSEINNEQYYNLVIANNIPEKGWIECVEEDFIQQKDIVLQRLNS